VAVGAFLGPSSVASFNVTNRVPSAISSNSMKLATPFFPSLAALFAQGDLVEAREIFFKINKVLVRISFFSVIVLFFANQGFVSLWVGDHLFGGKYVTGWLLLYVLLYIPLGGFGIIVYSSKRFGLWPFWLFVEMFVTIALSSYLASDFGMAGVVASFVIGATISQIYLFMLVQKELSFRFGDYLNSLGNYVYIPNIVTLLGAFILDHYIKISGWGSLISLVFILTILQFLSREGVRLILSTEVGFMKKLKWAFSL
jgi:O-antigen/teichoic acid export membrane protein